MRHRSVAVVGGGIAGMTAADELVRAGVERVDLIERREQLGGVVRPVSVAGVTLDAATDRVLAAPVGADRLHRLATSWEPPAATARAVVVGGRLRALPERSVSGIPLDLADLARCGLVPPQALVRVPLDHLSPRTPVSPDISVGEYVGRRLGALVADRLVAPYVLGAHAAPATEVSLRATMPAVYQHAATERSLLHIAALVASAPGPRHLAPEGGVTAAVTRYAEHLAGSVTRLRLGTDVVGLHRDGTGWILELESATDSGRLQVDGLVLAVPASAAAELLGPISLGAVLALGELGEPVDVGTVTVAYPRGALDLQGYAGFGRAQSEARHLLGVEVLTSTWEWCRRAAPELDVLRVLVGGELLARPDEEIVEAVHGELAFLLRGGRATYADAALTRMPAALPHYAVGHVDHVEAAREAIDALGSLSVCGASYEGQGVAAVIASANRAVADLLRP